MQTQAIYSLLLTFACLLHISSFDYVLIPAMDWHPIQAVLPPHAQCSQDRHRTYCHPDQDKTLTDSEWVSYVFGAIFLIAACSEELVFSVVGTELWWTWARSAHFSGIGLSVLSGQCESIVNGFGTFSTFADYPVFTFGLGDVWFSCMVNAVG